MLNVRVIPCLLLREGGLVKTTKFADPKYIGDPMNAVNVLFARSIGTVMGTDTICAPMISSIFHPNPLAGP